MNSTENFRIIDVVVEEEDEVLSAVSEDFNVDREAEDEVEEDTCVVAVAPIPKSPPLPSLNRSMINKSSNDPDDLPIKGRGQEKSNWMNNESEDQVIPAVAKAQATLKIIEPSPEALVSEGDLHPCPVCGRRFAQKPYEKHVAICEKVSTKKRKVFDGAKKRLEGLPDLPLRKDSGDLAKKKPAKPEDEFQKCPHCTRNFGPKAYDRHVTWCEEKSRRMQDSPNKDAVALQKLHARVAYRPKTPNKKDSSGSNKSSFVSSIGPAPTSSSMISSKDSSNGDIWTQSLHRDRSVSKTDSILSGTRSLGRNGGISFLNTMNHTKETDDTKFIRAATGRGSIKRGPAPTKASVLRQQKTITADEKIRSKTPNVPRRITSPVITSPRKANSPGFHLQTSSYNNNNNNNQYSYLIKPSAVRPNNRSSVGLRREPEGIEHVAEMKDRSVEPLLDLGQYDHSREYDPYQSAARQMQELLFGTTSASSTRQENSNSQSSANLRPSSNSAFQRYVPSPNVPSTADINSKFLSARSKLENYVTTPKKSTSDSMRSSWDGGASLRSSHSSSGGSAGNKSWSESLNTSRSNAKVAKFCHECGNPFALPDIRYCCECGVKRLYC